MLQNLLILNGLVHLLLTVCAELDGAVSLHTCSGWNQLTDDYVLLQTDQVIYLAVDSCLCQNLCGFLEGSS